jgi:hypothetical protein
MNPYQAAVITAAPPKKIIKALTLFLFAIAISTFTFAQGFHLGLKGGANFIQD